jgi:signal peptidase II
MSHRLQRSCRATTPALPEADPAEPAAGARRVNVRALTALALVAIVAYSADRVSKYFVVENLVLGESVPFIGDLVRLRYVENPGAAFSLGSGTTWIFAVIASAVAIFIVLFATRIHSTAWAIVFGLLLGGTLGNLTDRLTREPGFGRGYVVDFLELWGFPAIFNIADIAIVSSMGLFIILTIRGIGLDGSRTARTRDSTSA